MRKAEIVIDQKLLAQPGIEVNNLSTTEDNPRSLGEVLGVCKYMVYDEGGEVYCVKDGIERDCIEEFDVRCKDKEEV